MKPTKDSQHALVELVDILLRDGAVIEADIVITVADIPLIGISLRAAIAGMTTMTQYGLFAERAKRRTQSD
ncbi:MAG: gas vesicle protein [Haloquadratum sp. J07HQX50]|jgi:Gas vesicle protein.|nr:MAG: gas vesicle protein [Haloquadratum sp. J07HQX50]